MTEKVQQKVTQEKKQQIYDAFCSLDALVYKVDTWRDGLVRHLMYVASSQPAFRASHKRHCANAMEI